MTLTRPTLILTLSLFALSVVGQSKLPIPTPGRKWGLSLNPCGLFEFPMAFGAGISYRLSNTMELWSETSLLHGSIVRDSGSSTGIRQILQLKRFLDHEGMFIAIEARYRYFSYHNFSNFYSPAANTVLTGIPNTSYHSIVGAGVQIGQRFHFPGSSNGKFLVEITGGIGVKHKTIRRPDIPSGYKYANVQIDVNIKDLIETPGTTFYIPGSLRLIYTF